MLIMKSLNSLLNYKKSFAKVALPLKFVFLLIHLQENGERSGTLGLCGSRFGLYDPAFDLRCQFVIWSVRNRTTERIPQRTVFDFGYWRYQPWSTTWCRCI